MSSTGNRNHAQGAQTERMVVKYLREFWPDVDRRLREGRMDDQGDLDGVPLTTIQVKRAKQPRLQSWVSQTLKQRNVAGNPLCLLIVRKMHKPVEAWDAYLPVWYLADIAVDESEAAAWVRMDLSLAVVVINHLIDEHKRTHTPSPPSWLTTASS